MKILFLGNNYLGWQVLSWLKETGREVVGLVTHVPERQKYGPELLQAAALPGDRVFQAPQLREKGTLQKIRELGADVGLSVMFDEILRREFLDIFPKGCYNLHPGYLPYNRGIYANVWAIVEGTPAGVTLHQIDEGVDTGPIISRKRVVVEPWDTGESLYRKLERAGVALFREAWPRVERGEVAPQPQDATQGSLHRRRDTDAIDRVDLDKTYKARDLINLLRARTFPPYQGAYFSVDGRKVYMELKLTPEREEVSPKGEREGTG